MKDKKKILIIRLGALGDVVHTTIIADAIKRKHPEYEIHYLTQKEIAPILNNNPNIDKVITWNRENRKSYKQLFQTGLMLFKERYDIVFNLTCAIRNILLSLMCCSPKIVMRKHTKGLWVEDFFHTAKSIMKDIIIPERLYLGIDNDANEKITKELNNYAHPFVMITPGGGTDKNRQGRIWSLKNWKTLTEELTNRYGGTIFVCGSKSEREYHEQITGKNIVICTGEYNIAESSALLSKADLMISGDTGPMHIASAHGVKTIALLGSTSPDKIKPYGKNGYYISGDYDCKYCWKKKCHRISTGEKYTPCMEHITPNMILDLISNKKLL